MTRVQFLNELYRRLGGMSKEAAEQHLTYYAEMLADRMEEGMSEEEAVASMEDVDTIASRILQEGDEQAESGAVPPAYPDPPAVERSGDEEPPGTPAPVKKRRRWVLPAAIAAILCLAVLVFAFRRSPRRGIVVNDDGVYIGDILAVDNDGVRIGDFLYIGPDGIRVGRGTGQEWTIREATTVVEGDGSGLITGVEVIDEGWTGEDASYGDGEYTVSAAGISEIKVDWISGSVMIEPSDGDDICFLEISGVALDERTRLYYTVEDGELEIHFSEKGLKDFRGTKNLVVYVPQSLSGSLEELEVDVTSADVVINNVDAGKLSLDTTSGNCEICGNYSSVEADTVSGQVSLIGRFREVEFDSTSGDLCFQGEGQLSSLEADTVSGSIWLGLPTDSFTVKFETVSGSLDQGSYQLTRSNGERLYTSGKGECKIEVGTVSGSLYLQ